MNVKIKFSIIQILVVLIPASIVFYFALSAGMLADNDYWGFITHLLTEQGKFSSQITDWLQRENEHYLLIPKIIYALNIVITDGNNVALSLFTWFMALLQVFLLYHLIPVKSKQQPVLFTALLFIIAAFIFSPTQAHNWFFGMSGVAWISANFFVLSALFSINQYAITGDKNFLIFTFILSLFAVATYSTSLSLFPTLMIATLLLKLKRQDQVVITLFSGMILGLYLSTYSTPPQHPSLHQPANTLVSYFFIFIGSILTKQKYLAISCAFFGLFSSFLMLFVLYKKQTSWKQILPWVFIQLYACGNAAMASLARSGFTVEQAFSSRYSSLPALFWISWIMIASTLCSQKLKYRKYAFVVLICVSSVLVFNTYRVGFENVAPYFRRAEAKQLTLAALYSRAYDIDLIHGTIIANVPMGYIDSLTNILKASQHIPFNGIFEDCPQIGSQLTKIHAPINQQFFGRVDQLKLGKNFVVEIRGWAQNNNQAPACIAFTNDDNIVKGIAALGLSRPDIPRAIPAILSSHSGWQGYGNFDFSDKLIKVYMLSSYDQYWIPLIGYYQIIRQAPYIERVEALPEH